MINQSPLRCQRCLLGIDDDGDGNCAVCASLTDVQALKVKIGVRNI